MIAAEQPTNPSWLARADNSGVPLLIARLIIGSLFIFMGAKKIGDPFTFLKLMRQYDMLLDAHVAMNFIAVVLPWVEVVCGVALIAGVLIRGAALTAIGMLLTFTPLIYSRGMALFHEGAAASICGVKFDCGCGSGEVYLCAKLMENTGLILLSIYALFSQSRRFCLSGNVSQYRHRDGQGAAQPQYRDR